MTRLDPIIAVKNVAASADWYAQIFGFRNAHGGNHFAVLLGDNDEVVLCLHPWQMHDHPTMADATLPIGNGLILYFCTTDLNAIQERLLQANWPIEQALHHNSNSNRIEFSFRDPDGYFLTVTEFHRYEG